MPVQDQISLRLELMRARRELAFLLSDQVIVQANEIRNARRHINQLLDAINLSRYQRSNGETPVGNQ